MNTSSSLQVIKVAEETKPVFSIMVSDGQEAFRTETNEHEAFLENVRSFIEKKYDDHVDIVSLEIIELENNGSAWVTLSPKTDGIMKEIAEQFGLEVEKNPIKTE